MKLEKVSAAGNLHFQLKDGRIGVSYNSGYVRVSTKEGYWYGRKRLLYQINKVAKVWYGTGEFEYHHERVLIPSQKERLEYLMAFENKNCN